MIILLITILNEKIEMTPKIFFIPINGYIDKYESSSKYTYDGGIDIGKVLSGNIVNPLNEITFQSPIVFISNGIGDGFLALPTIRSLSEYFNGKLTIIYDSCIFPWWLHELSLNEIILIETIRLKGQLYFNYCSVEKIIKNCDLFISFNYGNFSIINELCNIIKPEFSVGFDLSFNIYLQQSLSRHATDIYFDVSRLITKNSHIKKYLYPLEPLLSTKFIMKNIFLQIKDMVAPAFVLAIHTDTQLEKMWEIKNWKIFLRHFFKLIPNSIVIILGASHEFKIHDPKIIDLTNLTFGLSVASLSYCDAFIGIDSCFLHIVDFLNIPSIGLFFKSSSIVYGLKHSSKHLNIDADKKNKIPPIQVIDSFKKLLLKNQYFAKIDS